MKNLAKYYQLAVRYIITTAIDDLILMAATNNNARKIQQIKKNQNAALAT